MESAHALTGFPLPSRVSSRARVFLGQLLPSACYAAYVYRKRQTSDSSLEFLRIENKQIKTVPNDSYGENRHKTTYFCVEAIKSKRKIRGKLGHVLQIHACRLA